MNEVWDVERRHLNPLVEQPEPTLDGDLYVIPVEALVTEGIKYVGIHFPDGSVRPDMVQLLTDGEG